MNYIIILLSFILESAFSQLLYECNFLIPLFVLCSFVVTFPLFKNKNNFCYVLALLGLLYDIVFYDVCFINTIVFFLVSLLIKFLYDYIKYNIYSVILINILVILFYRIVTYLLLFILGYQKNLYGSLFISIVDSLLINIIYCIIIYIIVFLNKRMKKK